MPLTVAESAILSSSAEGVLYGLSLFMYIITLWVLSRRNRPRYRGNYWMVMITASLLSLSTVELALNIARVYQGYVTIGPFLDGGPEEYFAAVTETTFLVKSCLYHAQTLIFDGVLIYRTYIVWQKSWIVVPLGLCWCGLITSCIGLNTAFATASVEHAENIFTTEFSRWVNAVYSMTLATNLSTTSLIAFKIWEVTRETKHFTPERRLRAVMRIIVESGVLYSLTIVAALLTYLMHTNATFVVLDMISPIISIAFSMIIVRTGLDRDSERRLGGQRGTSEPLPLPWSLDSNAVSPAIDWEENHAPCELRDLTIIICKDGLSSDDESK